MRCDFNPLWAKVFKSETTPLGGFLLYLLHYKESQLLDYRFQRNYLLAKQSSLHYYSLHSTLVFFLHKPQQEFVRSKKFGHWTLVSEGKKTFKWNEERGKISVKKISAAILDRFWAKNFKSETISFHYFSPRITNLSKFGTFDFGKWGQKDA